MTGWLVFLALGLFFSTPWVPIWFAIAAISAVMDADLGALLAGIALFCLTLAFAILWRRFTGTWAPIELFV